MKHYRIVSLIVVVSFINMVVVIPSLYANETNSVGSAARYISDLPLPDNFKKNILVPLKELEGIIKKISTPVSEVRPFLVSFLEKEKPKFSTEDQSEIDKLAVALNTLDPNLKLNEIDWFSFVKDSDINLSIKGIALLTRDLLAEKEVVNNAVKPVNKFITHALILLAYLLFIKAIIVLGIVWGWELIVGGMILEGLGLFSLFTFLFALVDQTAKWFYDGELYECRWGICP